MVSSDGFRTDSGSSHNGNLPETFMKPPIPGWFPEGFRMVSGKPETWFAIFSGWFPFSFLMFTHRKPAGNYKILRFPVT